MAPSVVRSGAGGPRSEARTLSKSFTAHPAESSTLRRWAMLSFRAQFRVASRRRKDADTGPLAVGAESALATTAPVPVNPCALRCSNLYSRHTSIADRTLPPSPISVLAGGLGAGVAADGSRPSDLGSAGCSWPASAPGGVPPRSWA